MCWRDDVQMVRYCSLCGKRYYGDLGHRYCPVTQTPVKPPEPASEAEAPPADSSESATKPF